MTVSLSLEGTADVIGHLEVSPHLSLSHLRSALYVPPEFLFVGLGGNPVPRAKEEKQALGPLGSRLTLRAVGSHPALATGVVSAKEKEEAMRR